MTTSVGKIACGAFLLLLAASVVAESQSAPVSYRLQYPAPNSSSVRVSLQFSPVIAAPAVLVIPRNYPGGYGLVPYDNFVENHRSISGNGQQLVMHKDADGPRWEIGVAGESISRIEYEVNIERMEQELRDAIDTSKVRPRYLGLLGYSVFGYVDGLEDRAIELQISAPQDWPVFTTLAPVADAKNSASAKAPSYYALADSEIMMGPDLQIRAFPGKIPLFLAAYAEGDEDLGLEGQLARAALDRVQSYFGKTPFSQYTVQLELLKPRSGHDYGFSQEHLDSGTFSLAISRAITERSTERARQSSLFNYAHHMAHCWIPKRAYGEGYLPFTWEMPPVIDTIWFNEGFGRYAAIQALVAGMSDAEGKKFRDKQLADLHTVLEEAPQFIKQMPLLVLSREASFMYTRDFRIGQNIFARGALMAAEIDDRIQSSTKGQKGLRDVFRYLVDRNLRSPHAFRVDELAGMCRDATGVDVHDIFDRWMTAK